MPQLALRRHNHRAQKISRHFGFQIERQPEQCLQIVQTMKVAAPDTKLCPSGRHFGYESRHDDMSPPGEIASQRAPALDLEFAHSGVERAAIKPQPCCSSTGSTHYAARFAEHS
jgi:hypothetical protein